MRNFECFRQVVAKGHALKSEEKMPVLSEDLLDGLTLFCADAEKESSIKTRKVQTS